MHFRPDWLIANLCRAKIMTSQHTVHWFELKIAGWARLVVWNEHFRPDWLNAYLCQVKIMASQHIGLPKSWHTKVLTGKLGIHLV